MTRCDTLIVGGGPAGSSCAWKLRQAGLRVIVLDRAVFPRDKPCAGWITPPVVDALELPVDDYRRTRVFQPIRGFDICRMGHRTMHLPCDAVVSYGICRSEFDEYLLRRSGATLMEGKPLESLRRERDRWIVNDEIETPIVVGAGGHFCPVARQLAGVPPQECIVAAREVEVCMSADQRDACEVVGEVPELYFCEDLRGYGWAFRKGDVLNVGLGREDAHHLPAHVERFLAMLDPSVARVARRGHWRGHAYLLRDRSQRATAGDGFLLVGDAAGLAYACSGEGIRPAVESGFLAAQAIVRAAGNDSRASLQRYERTLDRRFPRVSLAPLASWVPASILTAAARGMFRSAWLTRRVVLENWFLRDVPGLAA